MRFAEERLRGEKIQGRLYLADVLRRGGRATDHEGAYPALAEGHDQPHAHAHPGRKVGRNQVMEGPVNGKGDGGLNGD